MIIIAMFGRSIRLQYGNKVLWLLYLLGSLAGGLAMNFGMPNLPVVVPQVGSDAAISAMLTFYGLFNLNRSVFFLFAISVPMWVMLFLFRPFWLSWEYILCFNLQKGI